MKSGIFRRSGPETRPYLSTIGGIDRRREMNVRSKDEILSDLRPMIESLMEEWEVDCEISLETKILEDLQFESIDVVAIGSAIEEHYGRGFPFAQFLSDLAEQKVSDITLGELVDFVHVQLSRPEPGSE